MSGYLFLNAYTDHLATMENLNILKRHERIYKTRIAEFNQKNKIIDTAEKFVQKVKAMGLAEDRWDRFPVNLEDEPITFSKCQKIIKQTTNSKHYYFNPQTLHIRLPRDKDGKKDFRPLLPLPENPDPKDADSKALSNADLLLTLNGFFLIRK